MIYSKLKKLRELFPKLIIRDQKEGVNVFDAVWLYFILSKKPRFRKFKFNFLGRFLEGVDSESTRAQIKEIFLDNQYDFGNVSAPLIIDCGANIGLSVLYFVTKYPKSKIVAFEADSEIFSVLSRNLENEKNVVLNCAAVWDKNGSIGFESSGDDSGKISENKNQLRKVKSVRLKELIKDSKVDFLKIDIEGAELRVLKDCAKSLNNVKKIFIEFHSFCGKKQELDELLFILSNAGFRYQIKTGYSSANSFVFHGPNDYGMDMQLNIFAYR